MAEDYEALMHVHSCLSRKYLSHLTLDRIVGSAYETGKKILVITDSNRDDATSIILSDPQKILPGFKVYQFDDRGLVVEKQNRKLYVLNGMEFHGPQGHIISAGHRIVNKNGLPYNDDYDVKDTVDSIHEYGGLAIPAHILHEAVYGLSEEQLLELIYRTNLDDRIDAVETFNALNIRLIPWLVDARKYNVRAKKFAEEHNIPGIAAPDAHALSHMDSAYVIFYDLDFTSGEKLVESMRGCLQKRTHDNITYDNVENYVTWREFIDWAVINKFKSIEEIYSIFKVAGRVIKERL
ncbi:PHP domain-containing protein [Nanoarchaeota archaeon]